MFKSVIKMAYYAVARGNRTGIYNNWGDCKESVHGFRGAIYKKFNTLSEARNFIDEQGSSSPRQINRGSQSNGISKKQTVSRHSPPEKPYVVRTGVITVSRSMTIYVDGACRGNGVHSDPVAGYGVYHGEDSHLNAAVALYDVDKTGARPTNQRAELYAMHHALEDIEENLDNSVNNRDSIHTNYTIYTDSQYTIKALTEWSDKWIENGWRNSKGLPVANADIIRPSLALLNHINQRLEAKGWNEVQIEHVRGHAGIHGNERADELANIGANEDSAYRR